jgi:ubiquinone/menaquinone biosynthesis C-methylase UbiE
MGRSVDEAVQIQRRYYAETAAEYDSMHAGEGPGDATSLKYVNALLGIVDPKTILDVGAGTGRAINQLKKAFPGATIRGVEPVAALIEQAVLQNGVSSNAILQGRGESLPFEDEAFDVVCSFAILHHVPKPDDVVREMLRVARKAVLISDGNRFGQGSHAMRIAKLVLFKMGLWGLVNFFKTRGKGYLITEGDGLAYSYSVYDSFGILAAWADQLIIIPAQPTRASSWLHPLLTSGGVLVLALREAKTGGQSGE